MTTHLLQPERIVLPDAIAVGALVEITDGIIRDIRFGKDPSARPIPGTLLPGLIDLQVNGAGGRSVQEASKEALDHIAQIVGEHGASAFLPTLITEEWSALLAQVRGLAQWIESYGGTGATPLGIHVEGPFLINAGAHDPSWLIDPTPERIDELLDAGDGKIRLVTLAPGRTGAPAAVAALCKAGVTVSLGHGTGPQGIAECVAAGATMATHLFNAMGNSDHREPGMAHTLMETDKVSCSLIPDGHHVHPILVRQALKIMGVPRCVLITDSVSATGMPDGEYLLGQLPVTLQDGTVRNADGTLAGAALTMSEAASRFLSMVPDASAWCLGQVAARNPAQCIGANDWGVIAAGRRGEFAVLQEDGSLTRIDLDSMHPDAN